MHTLSQHKGYHTSANICPVPDNAYQSMKLPEVYTNTHICCIS